MEFIFIWLIFGVISALIASNKGRSGCGWFIIGVLLGPLGIILALVISKNEDRTTRNVRDRRDRKACPYCKEFIKVNAVKCKHCGSDLLDSHVKLRAKNCTYCGKRLDKKDEYCENCGQKVNDENNI